ncbi:WD40 repeat domain-containing protein [Streptomyces sp. 2A115]|uniref:WD40 repeat domain-containing protein n=1 Tax=Streptomyces sp. 2A115 TaxID=3457439 RepID=UPI003FCFAFE5
MPSPSARTDTPSPLTAETATLSVIDTAVFSPDGTRLAIVGEKGTVRIWHLSTGALHTAHTSPGESVRAVAFTPDSSTIAVVDIKDGGDQVTLLDTATGRTQRTIKPSTTSTLSLAFSPDGYTLATASSSGVVSTWNRRTGRLQDSFSASGEVASLAFSSDGRTLATSSVRGVQLWDLATSQTRFTLPTRSLAAVAFSPDGTNPGHRRGQLRRAVESRPARPGPRDPQHLPGHRHHSHASGTVPLPARPVR